MTARIASFGWREEMVRALKDPAKDIPLATPFGRHRYVQRMCEYADASVYGTDDDVFDRLHGLDAEWAWPTPPMYPPASHMWAVWTILYEDDLTDSDASLLIQCEDGRGDVLALLRMLVTRVVDVVTHSRAHALPYRPFTAEEETESENVARARRACDVIRHLCLRVVSSERAVEQFAVDAFRLLDASPAIWVVALRARVQQLLDAVC